MDPQCTLTSGANHNIGKGSGPLCVLTSEANHIKKGPLHEVDH